MELSELQALLTSEGLTLLEEVDAIDTSADVLRIVSRLRAAGHTPELVSAVVTQVRLREKAKVKFGEFASKMLFTRAGLEQATRMAVSAVHAARMRSAGVSVVADLGCGIGGDALAFASAGLHVHAVDADEVTAGIAAYNLAIFGSDVTVTHRTAQQVDFSGADALWFDPARRTGGHSETRRVSADEYSPPLAWVFQQSELVPTGMKLGPGHDRDDLPENAETQWISIDGSVVELVLWTNSLARTDVRRSALVIRDGVPHEITAPADAEDAPLRELGAYVHEPDGAIIRARQIGKVARALDGGMLADSIAYITSDSPLTSPFVSSFRVREVLPFAPKKLAKALREHNIGTLEIKKRGVDIDPSTLRQKLHLDGTESATLILTRTASGRVALLADRV